MSVPFAGKTLNVEQSDGSLLQVRASGSHRSAFFETPDGHSVVQDPNTGFFRLADSVSASLRRGAGRDLTLRTPSALAPGLNKPRWEHRRDAEREMLLEQVRSGGLKRAPPKRRTVGDFTGLCLLIDFPDRPGTIAREEVEAFCNRPGYSGFGNSGSVFDYFHDASCGTLSYRTVVAPYYTARHQRSFYTDPAVPYPQRAKELIGEALTFQRDAGFDVGALTADPQQAVYAMNVLYAGEAAEIWSKGLWPHASRLDAPFRLAPGRSALDYQITTMGEQLALGVYCHENGHMLCDFPDLYLYADQRIGVGRYCLMCLGANPDPRNPTLVGAYLRYRAGWGDAAPLRAGQQTLPPSTTNQFLIHRKNDTEYFIVENRRNHGRDAMLMSSGLAIWHIDELGSNTRPDAAPEGHQHAECRLLQADGLDELDLGLDDGDAQDLFGPDPNPVFVDGTSLSGRWWDGSDSGLQIHSIQAIGDDLSFIVELG